MTAGCRAVRSLDQRRRNAAHRDTEGAHEHHHRPQTRHGRSSAPASTGELVGPDDPGYDEARTVYNAMIDRRPALVAYCASTDDVAATIAFARRHDLLLAVRGGGHNGGGLGVCDDGVVLDLSRAGHGRGRSRDARPCASAAAATWGKVDAATHEHGLAAPSGIISTTGVGGLTLGGGIGYLARKHGLTIDNLLEAEVVLADGDAGPRERRREPRAVLGAARRRRQLRRRHLVPVPRAPGLDRARGPDVLAARADRARCMRWYREFIPAAPRELNGFFALMTVPPADFLPAELHFRKVCAVMWCYTRQPRRRRRAFAPRRTRSARRCCTASGRCRSRRCRACSTGSTRPGCSGTGARTSCASCRDAAIEQHRRFGETLPTLHSSMHLYPIDGAVHDVGARRDAVQLPRRQLGRGDHRRRSGSGERAA